MQIKLLRDGADCVGFGAFLHTEWSLRFGLWTLVFGLWTILRKPNFKNRRPKAKDRIIRVPSPPLDSRHSFAHSDAVNPSSLLKSPWAKRPALQQTDRRARLDLSKTARPV